MAQSCAAERSTLNKLRLPAKLLHVEGGDALRNDTHGIFTVAAVGINVEEGLTIMRRTSECLKPRSAPKNSAAAIFTRVYLFWFLT
jgi:hypothetical protein